MPKVRCKFRCVSRREYVGWGGTRDNPPMFYEYVFTVVTGGSPENEQFFASTPSGSVNISAVRSDIFVVGQEYYLDFTPTLVAEQSG